MTERICSYLMDMLMKNEYTVHLGIEFLELKKGYCKGRMKISEKIENPYGTLHGGSLYSMADIIAGTAACTYGHYVTTVSGNMNFLRPAEGMEYIYCEAAKVRQGKHLAVYDVKLLSEEGTVMDNASFTFFVTGNKVEAE